MKSKNLVIVAAVLALVILGFFAFGPRGGQQMAAETPAPVAETPADAAMMPAAPSEAAPAADAAMAPAGDAAVQADGFSVPAVDLDLPTEEKPSDAAPAETAPAETAPKQ